MSHLIASMSIRELRQAIEDGGLSHAGVTEKSELRELAAQALQIGTAIVATPAVAARHESIESPHATPADMESPTREWLPSAAYRKNRDFRSVALDEDAAPASARSLSCVALGVLVLACVNNSWPLHVGAWWTALDAVASDMLLQRSSGVGDATASHTRFFCGNFGLLLLDMAHAARVRSLLETMVRVTMMRGAQSAGLVTYTTKEGGVRRRVVNGKRTDLCELLMRAVGRYVQPSRLSAPQLFQVISGPPTLAAAAAAAAATLPAAADGHSALRA